jgi:small subunit ribosomal protein S4
VNGKKVNIPSFRVKPGDVITVKQRSKSMGRFIENISYAEGREIPDWLSTNLKEMSTQVLALPERHQVDVPVQEQLIVEYYSK